MAVEVTKQVSKEQRHARIRYRWCWIFAVLSLALVGYLIYQIITLVLK